MRQQSTNKKNIGRRLSAALLCLVLLLTLQASAFAAEPSQNPAPSSTAASGTEESDPAASGTPASSTPTSGTPASSVPTSGAPEDDAVTEQGGASRTMYGLITPRDAELSLAVPNSVAVTTEDGQTFGNPQQLLKDAEFFVTYSYGNLAAGSIDINKRYPLPVIPAQITLASGSDGQTLHSEHDGKPLGVLRYNTEEGMTFQFDPRFEVAGINNFYIKLHCQMAADANHVGNKVDVTFPTATGDTAIHVEVVDTTKIPPAISKKGPTAGTDGVMADFDAENNQITWTITVTNAAENPLTEYCLKDVYNVNQGYVSGSFKIDGVPVTDSVEGGADARVQVDETTRTLTTELSGETTGHVITYCTRILNTAFLGSNGIPKTGGTIACSNTARLYYPGGEVTLTDAKTANYNHPITWLNKTSGSILDRTTGEMEWTVTIRTNGLNLANVRFFDRLSPGIVIKDDTAQLSINGGAEVTLDGFARGFDEDQKLNNNSSQTYNLLYTLPEGNLNGILTITYHTVIKDPESYKEADYPPPDSIFNNKAFVQYDLVEGGGVSGKNDVVSPVVDKEASYDESLLGKNGTAEPARGTILWNLAVNANNQDLGRVSITDTLTPAGQKATASGKTVYGHYYDDSNADAHPVFIDAEGTRHPMTLDNSASPAQYTYSITPVDGKAYTIIFHLGALSATGTIQFRSTVEDSSVYAGNITDNNHIYENKARLAAEKLPYCGYANAEVPYTSDMLTKAQGKAYNNTFIDTYDYNNNTYPWLLYANENRLPLENICITDVLEEGHSLVAGSIRYTLSNEAGTLISWRNLTEADNNVPEGSVGHTLPYYTYDEATRTIKVYLPDTDRYVLVAFYAHVDPDQVPANTDMRNWPLRNSASMLFDTPRDQNVSVNSNVVTITSQLQPTQKTGVVHNNSGEYSIDYTVDVNRAHKNLPDGTLITDLLPDSLTPVPESVRLYHATAVSPEGIYQTSPHKEGGDVVRGEEVDPSLYTKTVETLDDGTSRLIISLPEGTGTDMYQLEYSCLVVDAGKAPFKNSVSIDGVYGSGSDFTVTTLMLKGATAGGTLQGAVYTSAHVYKTDADTGESLAGAVFGLYYRGGLVQTQTTDETGRAAFTRLIVGRSYTITELEAPEGYPAPEDVTKTFTAAKAEEGQDEQEVNLYAVTNQKPAPPIPPGGPTPTPNPPEPTPAPPSEPTPAPPQTPGVLQVHKTSDSTVAGPGQTVHYTITVSNVGGSDLTGVWIRDYVPTGMVYIASDGVYGYVNGREHASWFLATLAPGTTQTLTLTARIKECLAPGDSLSNTVLAEVTNSTEPPFMNSSRDPAGTVSNQVNIRLGNHPATGDATRAQLWILIFFGCTAALVLLYVLRRAGKKKKPKKK